MEVANEGTIMVDESAALDCPIHLWLPAPAPESCVHHQATHIPGLLRLRGEFDFPMLMRRYHPAFPMCPPQAYVQHADEAAL